ncbi:hypothetical protein [Thalassospira sp.]|uniref:hypothetical protein n=1 Tax=Thalassospira sp. TaxID=1912094 RepID=UPI000C387613|nr:hypothetical protein [Thalassospira sp.]MBC05693.1 hypothetical protein [Thalassospira sp.]
MSNDDANAHLTAEKFQGAFSAAFAANVGTYQGDGKITIKDLAARTGIKTRTLEGYRDHDCGPSGHKLMVLMDALPPRFANQILAMIGMGGAKQMTPEEISFHEVAEGAASYTAMFLNFMADGRIDHVERPELVKVARRMHDNLASFLHANDAPKTNKPGKGNVAELPKRGAAR